MKILKMKILTLLIILVGISTYGQKINNSDLIATWKLIKNETESNESKIDVGELVLYDKDSVIDKKLTDGSKYVKSNYNNIYIQIERDFIKQYFNGEAFRYEYTLKNNTIKLGQYDLKIVKLTKKLLILSGEKELQFEKTEINSDSYKLHKNKEPIKGLFNPLILFSYPNG